MSAPNKKKVTAPPKKKPTTDATNQKEKQAQTFIDEANNWLKKVTKDNLANINKKEPSPLEKALENLNQAINNEPQSAKAYFIRGKCYYHMSDFQRALFDFTVAIKIEFERKSSNKELASYYNYAGLQHFEMGQLTEALQYYTKAVDIEKTNGMYLYNKAVALSRVEQTEQAIQCYQAALLNLDQPDIYQYQCRFNKGVCLRRIGRLQESIEDLKKATELQPMKATAHNNLGLSLFEKEDYDDALVSYGKAIKLQEISIHYNNRGLANFYSDKLDDAKKDFDRAIELNPDDITIYLNRGNMHLHNKDFNLAHKDYYDALEKDFENPKLWHSRGLAFQQQAEFEESQYGSCDIQLYEHAIQMFQESLRLQPSFISANFHIGLMYHKCMMYREALLCFGKVLEKIKNDKTVYMARGYVYSDMGNHQLAIKDFSSAVALEPKLVEGYFKRGMSKLCIRSYLDAIEDLNTSQAKEEEMRDEDAYFPINFKIPDGLGQCYHALKDYTEAMKFYDIAIENQPENTDFLLNRALCHRDQQNYKKSIEDLERAREISEARLEHQPAGFGGNATEQTQQQVYSKPTLGTAIRKCKAADPKILYHLGISEYLEGKDKKCVKTLKEALQNKPPQACEPDIYYHIGLAYCNVEKFEKAIFPFTKCIEMVPSELNYIHERAKTYQMIEDHESAVADFTTVIKKNPKNAHAYFRRAFSLKSLKKYSESVEDFEVARSLDPLNPMIIVNYKQLKDVQCIVLCKPGEEKQF